MEMIRKKVKDCARCGQDHDVNFSEFRKPVVISNPYMKRTLTHWGNCPNTGEPILMYMTK